MNLSLSTEPQRKITTLPVVEPRAIAAFVFYMATSLSLPLAHAEESSIDTQNTNSDPDSGIINRAPLVSSKITPSKLDSISTSISNMTNSLNDILSEPTKDELPDEIEIETDRMETEQDPKTAQPIVADPDSKLPNIIDMTRPETKSLAVAIKPSIDSLPSAVDSPDSTVTAMQAVVKIDPPKTIRPGINRYLKIDRDGKALANNAETWSCVEDTDNGLIWEVKSGDGGVHDKNNSYSWFQPSSTDAPQGVADGGQCKGDISCDTQSYAEAVNAQNYCGYSDWRLPTREEMLSIVNFENTSSSVTINSDYFPDALPSWYWTASSNENHPDHAWYVLFRNGIAINDLKERPKHIRLVRNQSEKG